jgi:hypothetical protein
MEFVCLFDSVNVFSAVKVGKEGNKYEIPFRYYLREILLTVRMHLVILNTSISIL